MVKYKVIQEGENFYIKEVQTDQLIMLLDSRKEAIQVASKLNLGGGFDGFTPRFILTEG
jgi:hypothetical protein